MLTIRLIRDGVIFGEINGNDKLWAELFNMTLRGADNAGYEPEKKRVSKNWHAHCEELLDQGIINLAIIPYGDRYNLRRVLKSLVDAGAVEQVSKQVYRRKSKGV